MRPKMKLKSISVIAEITCSNGHDSTIALLRDWGSTTIFSGRCPICDELTSWNILRKQMRLHHSK